MNLLCIDYGTKRIGIAIATTPLAEPLEVIANAIKSNTEVVSPQAMTRLLLLLDEHHIEKIIVGISEETMAEQTRIFIEKLSENTNLPIEEMDETLSSYQAYEYMKSMKKSKREGVRDHYAAAHILQNYLDSHQVDTV